MNKISYKDLPHLILGHRHSIDTKAKISETRKGQKRSEETNAKYKGINNYMFGKSPSIETIAKISIARGITIYVYNLYKLSIIKTFSSASEAAKYFNFSLQTI